MTIGTNVSFSKLKTRLLLVATLVGYVLLAAYIHYVSLRAPYIGLELRPAAGSGWTVSAVEEEGLASGWEIGPGDRIARIDGSPKPRLIPAESGVILSRAGRIEVEKPDGRKLEFRSRTGTDGIARASFSIAMELTLLGIGLYAVRTQPESRVIRSFYSLNWLMALCILASFSAERSVSDLVSSYASVWLPYLLLSFYLQLAFRTVHSRFKKLRLAYQACSVLFSAYIASLIAMSLDVPKWLEDWMNCAVIGTLALLAVLTLAFWRSFDRTEQNQLLVLFSALFLSLLPYTFLYAIPQLARGESIVPIEYTLAGLVPFSCAITYLLVARSMLDMRLYIPRLLVHSFYLGAAFAMFSLAAKGMSTLSACLLFAVFALLTWGYQKSLRRFRRREERRAEWLERQKRLLSVRLGGKNGADGGTDSRRELPDMAPFGRNLLEAQQSERMRVAYYLHDHLLQNMIFLSRDLEELHDTGAADREQVAVWLKCVYDSQRDIRALCDDLYPPIIDQGDLKEALQWLLRTMKEKGEIRTELAYELAPGEPANESVKINLFRAVREYVHNVFKHSGASAMNIRLWGDRQAIHCTIVDDGDGFDVEAALRPSPEGERRFGLLSAYSQIRHLGGDTDIRSSPGEGTTVTIRLPLGEEVRAHA
ncbi:hypothetical protein J19TS2_00350 [Cohnella xylanilytica]|uniref:sensor histidine kinase n=1 Tax=Cohnella xylanilytica TaxID=557555 RepID=UPI001B2530D2|nr:ATP-binding protein [Cohnella xylanilytica]GIO10480.1 hypothetical protein J19TS2_00350 [Cohnella xylanilytica]